MVVGVALSVGCEAGPLFGGCDSSDNGCRGNVAKVCEAPDPGSNGELHSEDCGPDRTCVMKSSTNSSSPRPICVEKDVPTCTQNECRPEGLGECVDVEGGRKTWEITACTCTAVRGFAACK